MYLNFGNRMEKWSPDTFSVIITFGIGNFLSLKCKLCLEAMFASSSERESISKLYFRQSTVMAYSVWCPLLTGIVIKQKHGPAFSSDICFSHVPSSTFCRLLWLFLFQNTRWTWKHTVCYETFTPPTQDLF